MFRGVREAKAPSGLGSDLKSRLILLGCSCLASIRAVLMLVLMVALELCVISSLCRLITSNVEDEQSFLSVQFPTREPGPRKMGPSPPTFPPRS